MSEVKECMELVNDGEDERITVVICGRVCTLCERASEVAKDGEFGEFGLQQNIP